MRTHPDRAAEYKAWMTPFAIWARRIIHKLDFIKLSISECRTSAEIHHVRQQHRQELSRRAVRRWRHGRRRWLLGDVSVQGAPAASAASAVLRQQECRRGNRCDDGDATTTTAASSTCGSKVPPPPRPCAGDGHPSDLTEECDDGNTVNDNGCDWTISSRGGLQQDDLDELRSRDRILPGSFAQPRRFSVHLGSKSTSSSQSTPVLIITCTAQQSTSTEPVTRTMPAPSTSIRWRARAECGFMASAGRLNRYASSCPIQHLQNPDDRRSTRQWSTAVGGTGAAYSMPNSSICFEQISGPAVDDHQESRHSSTRRNRPQWRSPARASQQERARTARRFSGLCVCDNGSADSLLRCAESASLGEDDVEEHQDIHSHALGVHCRRSMLASTHRASLRRRARGRRACAGEDPCSSTYVSGPPGHQSGRASDSSCRARPCPRRRTGSSRASAARAR